MLWFTLMCAGSVAGLVYADSRHPVALLVTAAMFLGAALVSDRKD